MAKKIKYTVSSRRLRKQAVLNLRIDDILLDQIDHFVRTANLEGRGSVARLALRQFFKENEDPGLRIAEALLAKKKGRSGSAPGV